MNVKLDEYIDEYVKDADNTDKEIALHLKKIHLLILRL